MSRPKVSVKPLVSSPQTDFFDLLLKTDEQLLNAISSNVVIAAAVPTSQIWSQATSGVEGTEELGDRFGDSLIAGDFDGDGFNDLAIGAPGESVGSADSAGSVNVLYGTSSGLSTTGDQIWHQDSSGVLDVAESDTPEQFSVLGDSFAHSLAAGDFNGDGRDDLAVGVAGENIGSIVDAGAINVLYGSTSGLTATDDDFFHQNSPDVIGTAEAGDRFGFSLTTGDFDGDGRDDLAVGAPGEDDGIFGNQFGEVNVLYGSNTGLTAADSQHWSQDTANVEGGGESEDQFGSSLAAGDFNGDGRDDLAIGAVTEEVSGISDAGSVNVLYGSSSGLTATGDQIWHQNSSGVVGASGLNDRFATSLGAGDFNGDGRDDLAIGVPGETINSQSSAGAVNVLYGSNAGLTEVGDQQWSQNSTNVPGSAELGDGFGTSLAVGDFNGDGRDDLAIGSPGEDKDGAVNVLYGSGSGLTGTGAEVLTFPGLGGTPTPPDTLESAFSASFGGSLTAGDFNNDGFADLAIGAAGYGIGETFVVYGSASGLVA